MTEWRFVPRASINPKSKEDTSADPLPQASLLQEQNLAVTHEQATQQVPWLQTLLGPCLSQSCCRDIGTENKSASVALSEGTDFFPI